MVLPEYKMNAALAKLQSGEFEETWKLFGDLLESDPNNQEYLCGFYSSGYWNNRKNALEQIKGVRDRGTFLYREWEKFQDDAEARNFSDCLTYRSVMQYILGNAAEQFRAAFQQEGGRIMDAELFLQLSLCLLKIEDYNNTVEILNYGRKIHPDNSHILLLLGEAYCCQRNKEALEHGISFYRDSFLLEHAPEGLSAMRSYPILDTISYLKNSLEMPTSEWKEWFPGYLAAAYFLPGLKPFAARRVEEIERECRRLEDNLKTVIDKYKLRVSARLAFYYLLLMHHYIFAASDRTMELKYENSLREVAPELHAFYVENRE